MRACQKEGEVRVYAVAGVSDFCKPEAENLGKSLNYGTTLTSFPSDCLEKAIYRKPSGSKRHGVPRLYEESHRSSAHHVKTGSDAAPVGEDGVH